jgi:hypothetical protein
MLKILTGRECESNSIRRAARRCFRTTDFTDCRTCFEPVPVPPAGLKTIDIHVHRMSIFRLRENAAAANDMTHAFVGTDLPLDGYGFPLPLLSSVRVRNEAGPQNNTVRGGIAGRNSCGERIANKLRRRLERADSPHRISQDEPR